MRWHRRMPTLQGEEVMGLINGIFAIDAIGRAPLG
jgi:hypothetical protein